MPSTSPQSQVIPTIGCPRIPLTLYFWILSLLIASTSANGPLDANPQVGCSTANVMTPGRTVRTAGNVRGEASDFGTIHGGHLPFPSFPHPPPCASPLLPFHSAPFSYLLFSFFHPIWISTFASN
ncbi:uncharacterized protein BDW70DRAFT_139537 [Aspergillus foveolatus]|uniref:uncharacterized protein n=1 Tax=Aspergillus foveolatus TaxID=210207 RepID=UPI003CCD065F